FGLVGGWVAIYRQAFIGLVLFGVGVVCISIHVAIERKEKKDEEAAQAVWVAEVQRAADDVGLEDYGITSLQELARYHDAAGRAAVLAAYGRYQRVSALCLSLLARWSQMPNGTKGLT